MPPALTIADVERIATLAHLDLTSEEKVLFTRQLTDILAYAQQVQAIDTSGVPATPYVHTGVRPERDGAYLVDGSVTVRDLNRQFEWRLPDQDAATIAGLVIHEAKLIPDVGQIFMFHGFRFEIARRERNQITSIRVTPAHQVEPAAEQSNAAT